MSKVFRTWRFTPPPNPLPAMGGGIALVLAALLLMTSATAQAPQTVNDRAILAERPPALLSEYRLFRDASARTPNGRVTPYQLNTALYSDGALKFRYVYIPQGAQAQYNAEGVFEFPVGTVLVKTFAYAADMRTPTENVRFIETRLLIRRADGWVAYPYVWNEAQTEARYSPIGADVPVSFTDDGGEVIALDWAVPNRNQCKACHDRDGELTPIGPSARNLNRDSPLPFGIDDEFFETGHLHSTNQIFAWTNAGLLSGAPDEPPTHPLDNRQPTAPRVPDAYDITAPVTDRARAYLDVNCAHCHNPLGPGHTSGLDLSWSQTDPALWGVLKRPVAAGRASGGFEFAIEPGHPERSILVHRMQSTDPGVMMPELGRQLVDERGVELMREWIAAMNRDGRTAR